MYFQAFLDLKASLGITKPFFPFGGAANSSLLYLIARAVTSLPITSVCEFGAGQSTLLLDALATDREITVDTFEQREFWAVDVRAQLQHPERVRVHHSELTAQSVRGQSALFYDIAPISDRRFDLLIVDGPSGTRQRSRWGSLLALHANLADEFLLFFDDAERPGEMETCAEAVKVLEEQGIKAYVETIEACKSQFVVATERYRAACFY